MERVLQRNTLSTTSELKQVGEFAKLKNLTMNGTNVIMLASTLLNVPHWLLPDDTATCLRFNSNVDLNRAKASLCFKVLDGLFNRV